MSYKERALELQDLDLITESKATYTIEDDIDPYADHLHHTGSLKLFERERARIFEEHGMPIEKMAEEIGVFGFVYELTARYSGQVLKGDSVEVTSKVFQTRPIILSFQQIMTKDGQTVVEAVIDAALVKTNGRPTRIPAGVVSNLKQSSS